MPRQTFLAKPGEIKTVWRHIDAEGQILGRLATEVASALMGKHRPEYTPHVITGDAVIVTNAAKVVMTGRKLDQKAIRRWSGYPGGLKVQSYRMLMETNPEKVVYQAIIRMLPRGRLGRQLTTRLRVVAGAKHEHGAQSPIPLDTPSARHEFAPTDKTT
ncbi:MAG: 50S ribosomal protein L13 [Phycisphaerae bacterium]|nr:50S ribosomal protein L13 [Phycisphaerae bacterium]